MRTAEEPRSVFLTHKLAGTIKFQQPNPTRERVLAALLHGTSFLQFYYHGLEIVS